MGSRGEPGAPLRRKAAARDRKNRHRPERIPHPADSESTERVHPGWMRGIRIGSLTDGKVVMFIPPHMTPASPDGAMGEGIAVDASGNIYTAEATLRGITKYEAPRPPSPAAPAR